MRRGKPSAHVIYGKAMTINAATYAACIAMEKAYNLGHPDVGFFVVIFKETEVLKIYFLQSVKIFTKHLKEMHMGQGIALYWRENLICPTEEDYLEMAIQRTYFFNNKSIKSKKLVWSPILCFHENLHTECDT